jgi:hypothetical protein
MAIQDKATYIAQKNIDFANNTSQLITPTIQRTDRQNLAESLAWLSDTNTYTGQQRFNKGADVASATVLPLIEDGNYFDVTGTVTVTSFADLGGAGTVVILQFDAACILTHHATDLILPTGGNITTAAGDNAIFVNYATGDYRCLSYQRADGTSLVGGDVTKVGTPVNNQVGVWTGDGTLEGDSKLTFDGATLGVTGGAIFADDVTVNGLNIGNGGGSVSTNTAIGHNTLIANTTGLANTAVGFSALNVNTVANFVTAVGVGSLQSNISGNNNSALGYVSLSANISGNNNSAFGNTSLTANTTGSSNTAIGYSALTDSISGSNNVGIGYGSGSGITTGSGNTVLGANVAGLAAGLTNNIILANGTGAIKAQHDGTDWALTGNVGIGTSSPNNKLDVNGGVFINSNYTANVAARDLTIGKTATGDHGLTIVTGPTYTGSIYFGDSGNNDAGIIKYQHSSNSMQFVTNRSEKMRITSTGNVLIGTETDAGYKLHVLGNPNSKGVLGRMEGSSTLGALIQYDRGSSYNWTAGIGGASATAGIPGSYFGISETTNTPRFVIAPTTGNVGIGTTSPDQKLQVGGNFHIYDEEGNTDASLFMTTGSSDTSTVKIASNGTSYLNSGSVLIGTTTNAGYKLDVNGTARVSGALSGTSATFSGAVSKGSGSFRIEHPLPSLSETHQLVHSFVESPQADLIYRGKLTLVNGKAQANIDEVSTMTEGTFEVLCREVQCFTTNESGWDLIKGKVIGNIIYIESQNENSTDEISWMVIGERKDKHMMETEWTDENGKVIVEPLKPVEPEPVEEVEPTPSDDDL